MLALRYVEDLRTLGFFIRYFLAFVVYTCIWILIVSMWWCIYVFSDGVLCLFRCSLCHNAIHVLISSSKSVNTGSLDLWFHCGLYTASAYVPGHNLSHSIGTSQTPRDIMFDKNEKLWHEFCMNMEFYLHHNIILRNK